MHSKELSADECESKKGLHFFISNNDTLFVNDAQVFPPYLPMEIHALKRRQIADDDGNDSAVVALSYALDVRPTMIDDDEIDRSMFTVRMEFLDMDGCQASPVAVRIDLGHNVKGSMAMSKVSVESALPPSQQCGREDSMTSNRAPTGEKEDDDDDDSNNNKKSPHPHPHPHSSSCDLPRPQSRTYRMAADGNLRLWYRPKEHRPHEQQHEQEEYSWLHPLVDQPYSILPSLLAGVGVMVGFVIGFVIALVGRAASAAAAGEDDNDNSAAGGSRGSHRRHRRCRRSQTKLRDVESLAAAGIDEKGHNVVDS